MTPVQKSNLEKIHLKYYHGLGLDVSEAATDEELSHTLDLLLQLQANRSSYKITRMMRGLEDEVIQ